ncbi:MAG: hypothetical protein WCJ75_17050 [Desulfomonile sp.]
MGSFQYRGIVSSDWSECLSPNGPFDPIAFNYPEVVQDLSDIFKKYTGNVISLDRAISNIKDLVPQPLGIEQMDAYLDASFRTYTGVPELIRWCLERNIIFMINTTGTQGYFQRAIAKGLIPPVPIVAANPMIQFPKTDDLGRYRFEVLEIEDKPKNTAAVMKSLNLAGKKLVVIGDSGGDGPHFQWASQSGAFLIASMIKPSLKNYCRSREVFIDKFFGTVYEPGESRDTQREMAFDFMELAQVILEAFDSRL